MSDAAPGKPLREGDLKNDVGRTCERKVRLPNVRLAALYIADFDERGS
jgi:hypothetical protein